MFLSIECKDPRKFHYLFEKDQREDFFFFLFLIRHKKKISIIKIHLMYKEWKILDGVLVHDLWSLFNSKVACHFTSYRLVG